MNEHEAQRIAAAMHELRPDWPASSLLTLIRKNLIDKPRRDVALALTWVACESGTHNPGRVLQAGPWWKAAGTEGASTGRPRHEWPDDAHRCRICSLSEAECKGRSRHSDHEFETVAQATANYDQRIFEAMRQAKAQSARRQSHAETTTEGTERVAPVRAALAAARTEEDADA